MTTLYDDKIWDEYWESEEWKKRIPVHPRNSKIFSASEAREKLNKVFEEDDSELITIMEKLMLQLNVNKIIFIHPHQLETTR